MAETILGIDLGTTNSEVAVIRDGKPWVLEDDTGDPILPSFVGISEDGKLIVGKAARNQYGLAPERTAKSIKRKMGQNVKVQLGDKEFSPQEISAIILRALKDRATAKLGQEVVKAVITVPAYFNDAQRQATKEAGEIAGLEVVRILNEPTAASLNYNPKTQDLERILVYDLGGGTFDVSIVQAQSGVIEVLASHGDTQLGGDDFDELLLKHVALKFQQEHAVDILASPVTQARLLRAVEAAKRQLSFHPFVRLEEEFIAEKEGQALHLNLELSRLDYEALISPLLSKTMDSVQRALDDSKLTGSQIDRVVLVGGSTRTPMISELLEDRLSQAPHQEVDPDLCVAMGAAIQGGLIAGDDVGAVLVDISPHSLGIKCLDYSAGMDNPFRFARIVPRNSPLPSSRSEVFVTVHDKQDAVQVEVFQGENEDIRYNHRIGNFRIEGLAKVNAGNQVLVQLDLNLDGMLKVTAKEKATGNTKQITIENALASFYGKDLEQVKDRIDGLWDDAAEDDGDEDPGEAPRVVSQVPELVPGPREGQRETVQARALIEKAERLLDKIPGEDKAEVQKMLEQLRSSIDARAWDKVSEVSDQLSDILFYLEE